ncbi:MAG: helix-turn-helix domain-containing protein [Planctomycetota bacterium]|jgi:hypothetical protein
MSINLIPFGFTPTESLAYSALLDRGPTSAYSLSKVIGVARANVYQALNGLVTKGAAAKVSDSPQVFRPTGATSLLAMVAEREAAKLDLLESQVAAHNQPGENATIAFRNERSFQELALRLAVRAPRVLCIANSSVMTGLTPIWRKRQADEAETYLWIIGTPTPDLALPVAGSLEPGALRKLFAADPVLILTPEAAILGQAPKDGELSGYWSSDPLWLGSIRGTVQALTAT